jgi:hypothetical protein
MKLMPIKMKPQVPIDTSGKVRKPMMWVDLSLS